MIKPRKDRRPDYHTLGRAKRPAYPVLLVAGDAVAENTFVLAEEAGHTSVLSFLEALDADFEVMKARKRSEEILHDDRYAPGAIGFQPAPRN